jgi:putative phage-type endonuclease
MLDHAARAKGIGGSELAAILGLDPYRTPLDVWFEKTGRRPRFDGNEATFRGQVMEDAVGAFMERALGDQWKKLPTGLHVHPDYPWMLGHPDRLFYHKKTGERKGGELKTTIERIEMDDLTDPDNPKKLPWLFQCQWYMALTGASTYELGWIGPYFHYQQVTIEYNQNLVDYLIEFVGEWWERHIVRDEQPDPINASDALLLWPVDNGESFDASPELMRTIESFQNFKALAKMNGDMADDLADRIKLAFGPCSEVRHDGKRVATYKTDKRGIKSLRVAP